MGATGALLDGGGRIARLGIDTNFRAEAPGEAELGIVHVDGRHAQAHGDGILNGDMAETADAQHGDPLARPDFGTLQSAMGSDPGAEDGRQGKEIGVLRQPADEGGRRHHELGIAARHGIAGGAPLRQIVSWPERQYSQARRR
jgi:hypothetical protein